ncbi:MAG: hypothetical protein HY301_14805 [Verrucomicrobia bacterium]|nr:hypothetical protein [Verrucomicrobiota bacterium]
MKRGVTSVVVCLSLLAAVALRAQPSSSQAAEEEAIRRQTAVIETGLKVKKAQDLARQGDLATAAKTYTDALKLSEKAGGSADREVKDIISGLTAVNLQLAELAYRRGDFTEADNRIKQVLKLDPRNAAAIELKQRHDSEQDRLRGHVPSPETLARVPKAVDDRIQAATFVQDGMLLYELRKLDESEAKLKQAVKIDPTNPGALYYLTLIRQARYGVAAAEREVLSQEALVTVEKKWFEQAKSGGLPVPNPIIRTNLVNTGVGRQALYRKLADIRIAEVFFDGMPLSDVLKILNDEAKKSDPLKRGINFLLNNNPDEAAGAAAVRVDPTTGAAVPGAPGEATDINTVIIKVSPAIQDLTLAEAIDAIIKGADKPIKFSVEDYAIAFSNRPRETPPLYFRQFRVDPNTFLQGLESVSGISFGSSSGGSSGGGGGGGGGGRGGGGGGGGGQGGQGGQQSTFIIPRVEIANAQQQGGRGGGGGAQQQDGITGVTRTNRQSSIQQIVKDFFTANGVNVNPPNAMFWNDRAGILLVRASMAELDLVEQAIQVLNAAPPQVMIEAKFAEITETDGKALGFDWFIGNYNVTRSIGAQGGTAPSLTGPVVGGVPQLFPGNPARPNVVLPGGSLIPSQASTLLPQARTDQAITQGLRNTIGSGGSAVPAVATVTGILTDPQFRVVVRALEQRTGVDLLSAPKVTTLSGRQTQIAVVDILTVVTDTTAGTGNQNQNQNVAAGGFQQGGSSSATINPTTEQMPFGPVLDVIPYVSADGYTIQMTIIPTLTEFLGYDLETATLFSPQVQIGVGNNIGTPVVANLPLPKFRSRQLVTSCTVWDGQTVMLGGLIAEDVTKIRDKVPVLGDVPLLGRFFRSESRQSSKKNLVIFVSPTIIDPAGNRVHTDSELPFSKETVPAQPAVRR